MPQTTHAIGDLAYISGLPLSYPMRHGLVEGAPTTLVSGLPGELDARMAAGELAAGPISSLEYIRRRDRYNLVPNLSISAWGRIGSAVLFSRVPFAKLGGETIAMPPFGATSNALIQWLLHRMFGVAATYVEVAGTLEQLIEAHPAVLVIGDAAVQAARAGERYRQLDLGEAWWQMMKTPCVTSLWAVQKSLPVDEQKALADLFIRAKEAGLAHMPAVIRAAADRLGVPTGELEAYFHLLNYDLTPVHEQGVRLLDEDFAEVGVR